MAADNGATSTPVRVLFDATRLAARGGSAAPTGIDRVDLAYAQALSADPGIDLQLMRFDALGPQLLERRSGLRLLDEVTQRWRSAAADAPGPGWAGLRAWLAAPAGTARPRLEAAAGGVRRVRSFGRVFGLPIGGLRLRRWLAPAAPAPVVYVNTSHGRLFRRALSRWLGDARIRGVFFVHDLIPLEFPEFVRQREPARHAARLQTVATHARCVIVNSQATRTALLDYLQQQRWRVPPVAVLPLGIDRRFGRDDGAAPLHAGAPYFVLLGTIEPRKNHLLLLQVWRRLVQSAGAAAPRLVLVGRRGWENQNVFNLLDRCTLLARHVVECADLTDTEVAALLRGARALLAPTFGEGYGLPVAEALALGTPVIASAIAAHREVGGDCAEYLDPLDGAGWMQAIGDYAAPGSPRRERQLQRLQHYRPPSWDTHLSCALQLIRTAGQTA